MTEVAHYLKLSGAGHEILPSACYAPILGKSRLTAERTLRASCGCHKVDVRTEAYSRACFERTRGAMMIARGDGC